MMIKCRTLVLLFSSAFILIFCQFQSRCESSKKIVYTQSFPVKPLTRYQLSFEAVADPTASAAWMLKTLTSSGLVPYEGVFAFDWQIIKADKQHYTHSFLTPQNGSKLVFNVTSTDKAPTISNVMLNEIAGPNIVINGDLSAGLGNYSGWNIHERAKLVKNSKGNVVLKCQPTGFAVTDLIPVEPGGVYRYTPKSRAGRILTYDKDLLRIGVLPPYRQRDPLINIPADTSFIRIEYCDGRVWQKGRVPVISNVGLELVKKGPEVQLPQIPEYPAEIILKANSPLPVIRGAREIQHWVKKISGKQIKVLAEPSGKKNIKLFIGRKWAEELFPEDIQYLADSDGFAVRKKGDNIYIFSTRPAGMLFGAICFLEKNSDIIFARPRKEFGTVYSTNQNLTFDQADFIERPAFAVRMTHRLRANPYDTSIWNGRVGLNTPPYFYNQFRRKEEGCTYTFDSNYMGVINQSPDYSAKIVKEKYPDLYALENGKRNFKHKFICPTHPEAVKALTAGFCAVVEKAKKDGIRLDRIGVRVQDGWTVCSCERCMQPIQLPNGKMLKPKSDASIRDPLFFSTRKAVLMNQVAAEFAKIHPDINLSVEAYVYASEPPAIPYAPSLLPLFCAYPTCSLRFPLLDKNNSKLWDRRFRGFLNWSKKNNSKLSMFAYYYPCSFSAVADSAAADWRAMADAGGCHTVLLDGFRADNKPFKDFTAKNVGEWEYNGIEKWIITRLLWDPTKDPQKLREYYIKRAYQEAAPEMLKFYKLIRKIWKDPRIKVSPNCHTPMNVLFDKLIVETGNEKKLRSILVKALAKAVNPNSKTLIKRILTGFDKMVSTVNRSYIPHIHESTAEWNRADSTFWLQANKFGTFKKVSTWDNFKKAPAESQTNVSVMRDHDNVYFRFEALNAKKQDAVELMLEASRHATKFYFSLDRDGKRLSMRNAVPYQSKKWQGAVENDKDSYVAMFCIPLSMISGVDTSKKEFKVYAKFSRIVSSGDGRECEYSSLSGFALNRGHYMNYWTGLAINNEKQ